MEERHDFERMMYHKFINKTPFFLSDQKKKTKHFFERMMRHKFMEERHGFAMFVTVDRGYLE